MAKNKLRILFSCLGGGLVSGIGGGTIRIFELFRSIVQSELFEVHVVIGTSGLESFKEYFRDYPGIMEKIVFYPLKVSLFLKKEPFRLHQIWATILSMIHFRMIFHKLPRFDIGYAASPFFYNLLPLLKLKKKGKVKKLFSTIYHRIPKPSERQGLWLINYFMYKENHRMFDLLRKHAAGLLISDSVEGYEIAKEFEEKGFDRENILFVKMGVHLKKIDESNGTRNKYDILHIGVRPNKGIFDLPEILSEVVRDYPKLSCGIIGAASPSVKQKLQNEFVEHNILQNVTFLGFVSEEEKYRLIKAAGIFIAPSHEEGWGIAVGEAMAAETPVVAYDLPVYRHVYANCYIAVDCFNKKMFAEKIKNVLKTPTAFSDLIKRSRAYMEKSDWNVLFKNELCFLLKGTGECEND